MPKSNRPIQDLLAKVIFLVIPTMLVCFFILWNAGRFYAVLMEQQYLQQALFMESGIAAAVLFYSFRFRFGPTFAVLLLLFYLVFAILNRTVFAGTDMFFVSVQFTVFALLFGLGWMLGWGFIRKRYFPVFASCLFFIVSLLLMVKQPTFSVRSLLQSFVPLLLYTVYILYAVQVIYTHKDHARSYWPYLLRRLFLFLLVSAAMLGGIVWYMKEDIRKVVEEYGAGGTAGAHSMLQQDKDGRVRMRNQNQLAGAQSRGKQLLFVAHINSYFPGTDDLPNPLYLTAFYYSRFDEETETFERDAHIPRSDLFLPDPSAIPLFYTRTDSSVLTDALTEARKKVVEVEVYKTRLGPSEFVAPSVSYFIQPIGLDPDNQQDYYAAYRAKSYVSELNSAYFVYNAPDNPQLRQFQEARFDVLRQVTDYSRVPLSLMRYYTQVPVQGKYKPIATLAQQITAGKTTVIDKILAVRDYFLSKDENGKPLFQYSDNPGIPDIPSASKLNYFLFENRKGYCAYYAGATLFMLRSLGIPSRITVGFMTVDRSGNRNKGWYWYYSDQAHAWVQVYFPGYGWLDFDTTIGNDDARESPQPDGTPPNQQGDALLAIDGRIASVDTLQHLIRLESRSMVFKDKPYRQAEKLSVTLDLSHARIRKDSVLVGMEALNAADSATAVSYAEALKPVAAQYASDRMADQLAALPSPLPIDELRLRAASIPEDMDKNEEAGRSGSWSGVQIGLCILVIVLAMVLLGMLLPLWYRLYLRMRRKWSRTVPEQAYWDDRYLQFCWHQYGHEQGQLSLWQYARELDQQYHLSYASFVQAYLKLKYAAATLSATEASDLLAYASGFSTRLAKVSGKSRWQRIRLWLNPLRTIAFWKRDSA